MNHQKQQTDNKQDLIKRLRMSNKDFWDKLSDNDRDAIIKKYYNLYDIKQVGIRYTLDQNHNLRSSVYLMLIGLMLGLFGGAASNILLEYLPSNLGWHIMVILFFILLIIYFVKMVEKDLARDLGRNKILENLLELVKKENKN